VAKSFFGPRTGETRILPLRNAAVGAFLRSG